MLHMISYRSIAMPLLGIAFLTGSPSISHAQNKIINQLRHADTPSFSRTPEDLAYKPIHYRGFVIKPQLEVQTKYSDNVYYTQNNVKSDVMFEATPSLEIKKSIRDHSLSLQAQATNQRFEDLTDENNTTYHAALNVALQATKALKIPIRFSTSEDKISRSTPGSARFTAEPLMQQNYTAQTGVQYRFNRLNLSLMGEYARRTFDDGTAVTTGQPISFSANDRVTKSLSLLGEYTLQPSEKGSPAQALYVGITGAMQDYDRFLDAGGNDTSDLRNNQSLNVLAGWKTNYKNIIIGDIGAGYITYDYDDPSVEFVDGFDLQADLKYLITPKLTLNAQAGRDVRQDTDAVQGYIRSDYLLGAEYEILHDFYTRADLTFKNDDFINNPREDDTMGAALEFRYILTPRLQSHFGIEYETRDSSTPSGDYDQYIVRLGLTGSL